MEVKLCSQCRKPLDPEKVAEGYKTCVPCQRKSLRGAKVAILDVANAEIRRS